MEPLSRPQGGRRPSRPARTRTTAAGEPPFCGRVLKSSVALPDLVLDRRSSRPLYLQIADQIAAAIRAGQLEPGARLPSTRALSILLGVSRNVAVIAYETLAAAGWTQASRGSGVRVNTSLSQTLPPRSSLLAAAMYPERVSLFADSDGNPLYLRHPDRR